jgi:hypothetical protein
MVSKRQRQVNQEKDLNLTWDWTELAKVSVIALL